MVSKFEMEHLHNKTWIPKNNVYKLMSTRIYDVNISSTIFKIDIHFTDGELSIEKYLPTNWSAVSSTCEVQ